MKKINKLLVGVVSSLLVASNAMALTSCDLGGGINFGDLDVDVVAYDGSEVTVTFYHTMGQTLRDTLNYHIEEFNKLYPNIKIVHDTKGDYDGLLKQINTELTGGNSPTMAYCYSDHVASYRTSKAVVELDEFIGATDLTVTRADGTTESMGYSQEQINDFVDAYYDEGKAFGDNKMYMLPFIKSTEVLFYNKTYFEANDLEVPTNWDEMEALCARIKEIDTAAGKTKTIPLGYDSEANWFITMCEQLDSPYTSAENGNHFVFNNETNREFVKEFKSWFDKGYVTTKECYGGYTSDLFTAEGSYMTIGSTGGAGYQIPGLEEGTGATTAFEVGIAPIPQASTDASKHKVISQGPSVCLFKKENPQEVAAAWLFTKYLTTSLAFQAEFSMVSGYAPVIESVENYEPYAEFLAEAGQGNVNLKATCVKQNIAQKNACYVSPAFNGSSKAREQVGLLMQDIFLKNPSSGQTMDDFIQARFDKAISDLQYYYG